MARVVVKIGSNLLVDEFGNIKKDYIAELVRELSRLMKQGHSLALVSSGARAAGYGYLNGFSEKKELYLKQALCAAGQVQLMKIYETAFDFYGIKIAQILLTRDDFIYRDRFLNLRNTLIGLTEIGLMPIINENDTIATDEITLGDNDCLASKFSIGWNADHLILLTSVDGVLDKNGKLIRIFDPELELMKKSSTSWGSGGMLSKIDMVKESAMAGVNACICNGNIPENIGKFVNGDYIGTLFSSDNSMKARERWIAFISESKGTIILDRGAVFAVKNKKSILPVGITDFSGEFEIGDIVEVFDESKKVIGRGMVNCPSKNMEHLIGKKSNEIDDSFNKIFIHIDNFVGINN